MAFTNKCVSFPGLLVVCIEIAFMAISSRVVVSKI
ncbi:hypothetical protein T08_8104 [Trichinella sp. T8]|nr:hypothetical protein T08_8104 [Trichinella sp. T8]